MMLVIITYSMRKILIQIFTPFVYFIKLILVNATKFSLNEMAKAKKAASAKKTTAKKTKK